MDAIGFVFSAGLLAGLFDIPPSATQPAQTQPSCYEGPVHVRVFNSDGSPAPRAEIGIFGATWYSQAGEYPPPRGKPHRADERGELHHESVRECIFPTFIYAFDEARQLAGFRVVERKADLAEPVTVKLRPARWVTGEIVSSAMTTRGDDLDYVAAFLSPGGQPAVRARWLRFVSKGRFRFLLPSGDYLLGLRGDRLEGRDDLPLLVGEASEPLNLGKIDLPISRLTRLTGQPAPEWDVAEWSDGRTRSPASMRGRPLVLCFWHKGSNPRDEFRQILETHRRLRDSGVPLLAIHSPEPGFEPLLEYMRSLSAEDIAPELGRDPRRWPFPCAIDRPIEQSGDTALWGVKRDMPAPEEPYYGRSILPYGRVGFPLFVLIGADGRIVANSHDRKPDFAAELSRVLGRH